MEAMQRTLTSPHACLKHFKLLRIGWQRHADTRLSSRSRDLLLHCNSWQWRYISFHANLQKKPWRPWNASSEKKLQDGKRYMSRWKWAGAVIQRENVRKMDPTCRVLSAAGIVVSPERHNCFIKACGFKRAVSGPRGWLCTFRFWIWNYDHITSK